MKLKPSEQTDRLLDMVCEIETSLLQTLNTHMHCAKANLEGLITYPSTSSVGTIMSFELTAGCKSVIAIDKKHLALAKAVHALNDLIRDLTSEIDYN